MPTNGYRSGEPLSKATLYATLTALTRFFVWLAGQPGYKSRISYSDAEYFNLSAKETRIAKVKHWSSASPIRQIFKEAFAVAGLQSHSFRKTLALLGGRICITGGVQGLVTKSRA